LQDLEKIPGVGLKTSRFFLTHSRPNQSYAILDTHILRHMRDDLNIATPKTTPTNPKVYYALEAKLLEVVRASGKSYADYDLEVWSKRVLDKKNKAAKIVA
jgi:thermostable 8-oxoguanine DNA glycosylase